MPRPSSLTFTAARRLGRLEAFAREHPAAADRALFDRLLRAMATPEPPPKPKRRGRPKARKGTSGRTSSR